MGWKKWFTPRAHTSNSAEYISNTIHTLNLSEFDFFWCTMLSAFHADMYVLKNMLYRLFEINNLKERKVPGEEWFDSRK